MRKRNLRKKTTGDDDVSRPEPNVHNAVKRGVLSFDVDEEPVVTQLDKKNQKKHRVLKKRLPEGEAKPLPSTQVPSAGDYTAEKLEELKKQTKGTVKQPPSQTAGSVPPILKVSGSFKPASSPAQPPIEAFVRVRPEIDKKKEADEKLGEDQEGDFIPPNTQTIQMAKAKRERLRQAQLAPDYLPLGGASTLLSQEFKQKEERPPSESDEEEDHMRLRFVGHLPSKPKVAHEEMDMDLMEDEDAVDSFVDTQIKKGIAAMGVPDAPTVQRKKQRPSKVEDEAIVLPIVSRTSISATAAQTWDQILEETTALEELHKTAQKNLDDTKARLKDAQNGMESNKEEAKATEERYREVQEWRDYMADLCACLKEKIPFIEALEDHLQELYDERATNLEQEALEYKEGQELADMASTAILESIAAEESLDEAGRIAQIAVRDLEGRHQSPDDNDANQKAVRRGEKRKRRWETALYCASHGEYDVEKDKPLDDIDLMPQLEEMKQTAKDLFLDVLPEMQCISSITRRLEEWKSRHPKLYEMAYVPDSLPALLAPFVRCEVLTWSPLNGTLLGLEAQKWYTDIENFGGAEEEHLVPEVVRQVVLPVACQQVRKCWSPFLSSMSKIVAEIIREMLVYVPVENIEIQKLLRLVQEKLKGAVDEAGIPPYTRPAFSASRVVQSVVEVRFRRALHLAASLCCFTDILPGSAIKDLLLTELMCEKLLPCLRALTSYQPRNALQKIVSLLSLVPQSLLSTAQCPVEFMQISEVLSAMGRSMEKQKPTKREDDNALITSFVKWLFHFGKKETAISVQETFLI